MTAHHKPLSQVNWVEQPRGKRTRANQGTVPSDSASEGVCSQEADGVVPKAKIHKTGQENQINQVLQHARESKQLIEAIGQDTCSPALTGLTQGSRHPHTTAPATSEALNPQAVEQPQCAPTQTEFVCPVQSSPESVNAGNTSPSLDQEMEIQKENDDVANIYDFIPMLPQACRPKQEDQPNVQLNVQPEQEEQPNVQLEQAEPDVQLNMQPEQEEQHNVQPMDPAALEPAQIPTVAASINAILETQTFAPVNAAEQESQMRVDVIRSALEHEQQVCPLFERLKWKEPKRKIVTPRYLLQVTLLDYARHPTETTQRKVAREEVISAILKIANSTRVVRQHTPHLAVFLFDLTMSHFGLVHKDDLD
jgi:hypothetical protein